jgi:hypothetical protein
MITFAQAFFGLLADEAVKSTALNPLGWAFMLGSVGFVVILTLWCFTKVLSLPTDPAEVAEGD